MRVAKAFKSFDEAKFGAIRLFFYILQHFMTFYNILRHFLTFSTFYNIPPSEPPLAPLLVPPLVPLEEDEVLVCFCFFLIFIRLREAPPKENLCSFGHCPFGGV